MADTRRETYERIGRQMTEAFTELVAALSEQLSALTPRQHAQVEALRAEVATLQARLERLEGRSGRVAGAQAAPAESRSEGDRPTGRRRAARTARRGRKAAAGARKAVRRKRTPKEEVRERALEAGRALASRGETVNLKTVADAAGLNYGQVTYAFRRKENLLKELGLLQEGRDRQTE